MRDEAHQLELGYYVIKNPTKVQREESITFEEARLAENEMQPSGNPRFELFRMIKNWSTIIKKETTCSNDQTELWKSLNNHFAHFKEEFYALHPVFLIGCNANSYNKKILDATFDILEDFIEDRKNKTITKNNGNSSMVNEIVNNARGRLLPGSILHRQ
ncbi:11559_t:CDS:2 [Gigaspora rosea]|nr:11559_t:CDS:2 [Gigaspora rosea]